MSILAGLQRYSFDDQKNCMRPNWSGEFVRFEEAQKLCQELEKGDAPGDGRKIVEDFEAMFGRLTATERTWLADQIAHMART